MSRHWLHGSASDRLVLALTDPAWAPCIRSSMGSLRASCKVCWRSCTLPNGCCFVYSMFPDRERELVISDVQAVQLSREGKDAVENHIYSVVCHSYIFLIVLVIWRVRLTVHLGYIFIYTLRSDTDVVVTWRAVLCFDVRSVTRCLFRITRFELHHTSSRKHLCFPQPWNRPEIDFFYPSGFCSSILL